MALIRELLVRQKPVSEDLSLAVAHALPYCQPCWICQVNKAYGLSNIVSVPDIRRLPALRCHLLLALLCIPQTKFSITCVVIEGWERRSGWGKGSWEHGNWDSARDWWGGKFASLHNRLLLQVRDFSYFNYHRMCWLFLICAVNTYASYAINIFILCRLKINHGTGDSNMRLFLHTVRCVWTKPYLCFGLVLSEQSSVSGAYQALKCIPAGLVLSLSALIILHCKTEGGAVKLEFFSL